MDKGESTQADIEKLKKMVPKSYQKYIESKKIIVQRWQFFNWNIIFSSLVYGNGYLTENHHENDLIEEDWTMADQSQSSFSQDSTRYENLGTEYIEEDTIGSEDGI